VQDSGSLREMDDRFLLPHRNRRVTQVIEDYVLTLVLDGDVTVSIEGMASLSDGPPRPFGCSDPSPSTRNTPR